MCNHKKHEHKETIHFHHHGLLHDILRRHKITRTTQENHGTTTHGSPNTNQQIGSVCFVCGKINPKDTDYCVTCGSTIYKCPISNAPFSEGDEFVQCPYCNSIFHAHHFDIWTQTKNACPYCGRSLTTVKRGIIGKHYFEAPPIV